MLPLPRPLKLIIKIPVESIRDIRPQQPKDRLKQIHITRSGASLGVDIKGLSGEEMLRLGVACDFSDFGFDGVDAEDSAEGDGDGVGGVGSEEGVETVEFLEVEGEGVEVDGLTDGVNVREVGDRAGVSFFGECGEGERKKEGEEEEGEGGADELHDGWEVKLDSWMGRVLFHL